jgi:hypothetical protein
MSSPMLRWRDITLGACLAGALGCEAEPAPQPTPLPPDEERPSPSPYDPTLEGEEPSASLDAEQASAALPTLLAQVRSLAPLDVLAAHDALLGHADDTCPGVYDLPSAPGETSSIWVNDCVAGDGTHFRGYVQITHFDRTELDGERDQGFIFSSGGNAFEMEATDGTFLRGSFYFEAHSITYPDTTVAHVAYKSGDVVADEVTAGGNPWLSGAIGGDFGVYGYDAGGLRLLQYEGAFATRDGGAVSAFQLREFSVDDFACPLSTLGSVSLRGLAGGWHEATFGDPELLGTGAECDACADYAFGDEPLGDLCAATAALEEVLSWETTPW